MAGQALRRLPASCLIPLLALLFTGCQEQAPPALKVAVGQPFPELHLQDVRGRPVSTVAYRGKPLILNVWATWCAPCRKELPSLQNLQNRLAADGVVVLGMSVDADAHLVREYLIDRGISFTSHMDPQMSQAGRVLGVRLYPSTFLVDASGVLREVVEGEKAWDSADMVRLIRNKLSL